MTAPLTELLAQRDALQRQILEAQNVGKQSALAEVRRIMAEHGLTVADLNAKSIQAKAGARSGSKVAPKYREPGTGTTWSGRGLKPKWLVAALESGKSLSDFAL